jgi:hypothetical protein
MLDLFYLSGGIIMARGMGGGSPSNLAHFLKGIDFPAQKTDLVKHAKKNNVNEEVIQELNHMSDHKYSNMADVMKGFGKEH